MNTYSNLFSHRGHDIEGSAIRAILAITQQPGIISFAGGLPSNKAIPAKLIARLTAKILSEKTYQSLQYSVTEGLPHIREFLCTTLNERYGTSFENQETLITTGSQQAIDLTVDLLVNRGDNVIVERPTYLAALQILKKAGARLIEADCDHNGIKPVSLEKILKTNTIKLIYTNPDHQNPSGFEMPEDRREALFRIAEKNNVPILEDGAYREIRFEGKPLPPIASFDKKKRLVIFTNTASKILAPGLRIGWVYGPNKIINKMALLKQSIDIHTPGLNQEVVYQYLSDGYFEKQIPVIRNLYKQKSEVLVKALYTYGRDFFDWQIPKGGMFIWARVKKNVNTAKLLPKIVKKQKVAYVPGATFFARNPDQQTLRLNFTKSTDEQINIGVKRLIKGLSS